LLANVFELSIHRQCDLIGLLRSQYYCATAGETPENFALMRLIDQ
jgi:hypothetical protein